MSDATGRDQAEILAVDQGVGDDDDMGGLAQPVTQAEVEDALNSPQIPIEERVARLQEMARRLGYRQNVDRAGEFDPLIAQINEGLNMLAEGGHAYGTLESSGLETDARSDARAPDDTGPGRF